MEKVKVTKARNGSSVETSAKIWVSTKHAVQKCEQSKKKKTQ